MNNTAPAILFITECTEVRFFSLIKLIRTVSILINAMPAIHRYIQIGISIRGSNLMIQTTVNTISAIVSSFEPNSLTVSVFLATVPSIISVRPAVKYKV